MVKVPLTFFCKLVDTTLLISTMNFETSTKDSIESSATKPEKRTGAKEKLELINKVLKRLALWGMLSTAALPVAYVEALGGDRGNARLQVPELVPSQFFEQPSESKEADEDKPVVAIAAESDTTGVVAGGFAEERFTRDELIASILKNQPGKFVILDHSTNAVEVINEELRLQATDLFDPSTKAKVRHLEPDYYVYVSEKPGTTGGKVELSVSVINMKTGNTETSSTTIPGSGFDDLGRATLERVGNVHRQELIAKVNQIIDQL